MNNYVIITVLLLIFINFYGVVFSYLITKKNFLAISKIQVKKISYETFLKRIPLCSFNILILIILNVIALQYFDDFFLKEYFSPGILCLEVFIVLIIDDFFFYFLHKYMHTNKFIYKKIHKIHHRANTPIPIEYIYVHPFEWMSGMIGPFIGMVLMGGISFYSYVIYLLVRNFHELHIHSGILTSKLFKILPFYGTNEHHDMHHSKRDGNYSSTFTYLDYFFKTKI